MAATVALFRLEDPGMTQDLSVLRISAFRYLLLGRTVSLFGGGLASIALAFAVLDLTGSAGDLGIVLAARSIPNVVFLLVGGVIADRLPRHKVLVMSNVVSGLSQATAAALLFSDRASIAALVAVGAVNGSAAAFTFPASAGLLPQTVPPERLQPANVLLRMGTTGAMVGGASLGGVIVAAFGPGWGLAVDALTFLVAAGCFAAIRLAASQRVATGNTLVELREGWTAFRSRSWLWVVVLAFGVINAVHAAGWFTLGPVVADQTFGRAGWGLVVGAETVGMVAAGVVLLRVRFRRPLYVGMLGVLGWSPLLLVLAAEPRLLLLVGASVLAGAAIELFSLGWDLSMQQHIPPHQLSRVYSYDALGSLAAIPAGQLLAGPLAHLLGVRGAVAVCGVAVVVAGVSALAVPSVRRLERTDLDPVAAAPVAG